MMEISIHKLKFNNKIEQKDKCTMKKIKQRKKDKKIKIHENVGSITYLEPIKIQTQLTKI